ncbi:MAG: tetratricopeptide repeat protein, partial [Candidatus Eremiobacteraeota bacterium]|nr:tetratricopeptide repeat protein [Candidatus Eremiobacteraeota bacterium]
MSRKFIGLTGSIFEITRHVLVLLVIFLFMLFVIFNYSACQRPKKSHAGKPVVVRSLSDMERLRGMLEKDPDNPEILLALGEKLLDKGELEKAGGHLEKVIKQDITPYQAAKAHILLGKVNFFKKKFTSGPPTLATKDSYTGAVNHLKKASQLLDKTGEVKDEILREKFELGQIFYTTGFTDLARNEFRKIARVSPGTFYGMAARIMDARLMGEYENREKALKKLDEIAVELDRSPESIQKETVHLLGQSYYHLGEYQKAIPHLKKSISFMPESDFAQQGRLYLSWIMLRQGKPKKASLYLKEVSRSIKSRLSRGEGGEAISGVMLFGMMLDTFVNMAGQDPVMDTLSRSLLDRLDLAADLFQKKNYTGAMAEIDRCVALLPKLENLSPEEIADSRALSELLGREEDDPVLLFERGTMLFDRGEKKKAIEVLERLVEKNPGSSQATQAIIFMGNDYKHGTELDKTIDNLEIKGPNSISLARQYAMLADYLFNYRRYKDAEKILKKVISAYSDYQESIQAKYLRCRCLAHLGKTGEAKKLLKELEGQSVSTRDSFLFMTHGRVWADLGEKEKAEQYFRKAIEFDTQPTAVIRAYLSLIDITLD